MLRLWRFQNSISHFLWIDTKESELIEYPSRLSLGDLVAEDVLTRYITSRLGSYIQVKDTRRDAGPNVSIPGVRRDWRVRSYILTQHDARSRKHTKAEEISDSESERKGGPSTRGHL